MNLFKSLFFAAALVLAFSPVVSANEKPASQEVEESAAKAKENVKEGWQDTKKNAGKAGRKAKDETCEMVNGKMECAVKKAKHKVQDAGAEASDAVN